MWMFCKWTIHCSVSKPWVPVGRGKLNDRPAAEASQGKVEVASTLSRSYSRSIQIILFSRFNSVVSARVQSFNKIAMNQQRRLCCAKTKRHTFGQLQSTLAVGATVKDRLPANAQSSPVDTLFQVAQFCSIDHTGS
ncbi:hypothetical protein T4E_6242 [Trichinella pseudospiralis]|uniref:Uncharacterized protein n=1 Tax=Trichinella pseudospiralis TaxID=6337 RepID=A0A0V0Y7R5_TRIPS|nr:hypothetical protein T4E_6242 [Trichinella pseudospiralis]